MSELTEHEQVLLDSFPADAVEHWLRGEWWDGEQWLPERPVPAELDPVEAMEAKHRRQILAREQTIDSLEKIIATQRRAIDRLQAANDSLRGLIDIGEASLRVAEMWHRQTAIRMGAIPDRDEAIITPKGRQALDELANALEEAGDL